MITVLASLAAIATAAAVSGGVGGPPSLRRRRNSLHAFLRLANEICPSIPRHQSRPPPPLTTSERASTGPTPGASFPSATASSSPRSAPSAARRGPSPLSSTAARMASAAPGAPQDHPGPRPPNKKAISRGLCFSIHLSLLFVNKTTPPRSTFLDSTCGLPKGLEANAPVPASNGHCWSRAVSGKVDLGFFSLLLPRAVFSLPVFRFLMHNRQHHGARPEVV